jgi:hypothetical protein
MPKYSLRQRMYLPENFESLSKGQLESIIMSLDMHIESEQRWLKSYEEEIQRAQENLDESSKQIAEAMELLREAQQALEHPQPRDDSFDWLESL